jgi:hypothetical protein
MSPQILIDIGLLIFCGMGPLLSSWLFISPFRCSFLPLQVLRNTEEEGDLLEKSAFLELSHVLIAIANEAEPVQERK